VEEVSEQDIDVPVQEFGKAITMSTRLGLLGEDVALDMLLSDRGKFYKILDYFKYYKIVEEKIVDAPQVDPLARFKTRGWHSRIAINGYAELQEHFKCRMAHEPQFVNWKYVKKILRRWWNDRKGWEE